VTLGNRHLSPLRCVMVWLATTLGAIAVVRWCRPDLTDGWVALRAGDLAAQPFEQVLVWLCAVVVTVCAGWLVAVTTVVVGAAAVGRAPRHLPGAPAWLRTALLAACGVALVGGLAAPSYAGAQTHHDRRHVSVLDYLVGLALPDRATAGRLPHHASPTAEPPAPPRTVVVRPGDTLWSLAAVDLPPGASDAAVAERWHAIYAANRATVGADPDVIEPGQRLRLP
jgi:hypothetical protein